MAPAFEDKTGASPENFSTDDVSHKSKVTVVGSGNWGSVAAKLIASNALKLNSFHGTFVSFSCYFPFLKI